MKINYIAPANVEELLEIVNINTPESIAAFEIQIEDIHTECAAGRNFDVCVVSPKMTGVNVPFPQCLLGWDGHPFIMVNVGQGLDDIRHMLLATIANFDMLDSGDLVYHGDQAKEATYRGEFFSEEKAMAHIMPYVQQMMSGEIDQVEFGYRAIWSTPWAIEAHRQASQHYTPRYVL